MSNCIKIHGITTGNCIDPCKDKIKCVQFSETDKINISKCRPSICEIHEAFVNIQITSFKVIQTCECPKLIINGLKCIKILYTSDNECGNLLCETFSIPFCNFIKLNPCGPKVCNIIPKLEYCNICNVCPNSFYISTVIKLCPKFFTTVHKDCNKDC